MIPLRRVRLYDDLPIDHRIDSYFSECHNHEYYEFVCVVHGRGLNVINNTIQILESKSLMLIRPEDIHYIKKMDEFKSQFEYFNIPVPIKFIENEFSFSGELKGFVLDSEIPRRVRLHSAQLGVLSSKLLKLKEMPNTETRKYLYYKLSQEMCGYLLSNKVFPEINAQDWFSQLLVKIENLDIKELSYETILNMANVSGTALWKAFKKHLNISPNDYIRTRRAETAYDMILNSNKSFLEIAMELNYGSYVQFYREIKNHFGLSPKEICSRSKHSEY